MWNSKLNAIVLHDDLVFLLIPVAMAEVYSGSSGVVSCMITVLGVQNHGYENHVPSWLAFPFNQGLKELGKVFLKREKVSLLFPILF